MGAVQIFYYTGKYATYQLSASEDDRGVICGGIGIYGGNPYIGLDIAVYKGWDYVEDAFEQEVDAYENNGQFRPVGGWGWRG